MAVWGAFRGVFLSSIGALLTGVAMLKGGMFTLRTARVGIAGSTLLVTYTICATFAPFTTPALMVVALPGGLMMMAWNVMVARRLLALANTPNVAAE